MQPTTPPIPLDLPPKERCTAIIEHVSSHSDASLSDLVGLSTVLTGAMAEHQGHMVATIMRAIMDAPNRTLAYAILCGLLNRHAAEFGACIAGVAGHSLRGCLEACQFDRAETCLHFAAALCATGVARASSLHEQLTVLASVTAESGVPQCRTDAYAWLVMATLPWSGHYLAQAGDAPRGLLDSLRPYLDRRIVDDQLQAVRVWNGSGPEEQQDAILALWDVLQTMDADRWPPVRAPWRTLAHRHRGWPTRLRRPRPALRAP